MRYSDKKVNTKSDIIYQTNTTQSGARWINCSIMEILSMSAGIQEKCMIANKIYILCDFEIVSRCMLHILLCRVIKLSITFISTQLLFLRIAHISINYL